MSGTAAAVSALGRTDLPVAASAPEGQASSGPASFRSALDQAMGAPWAREAGVAEPQQRCSDQGERRERQASKADGEAARPARRDQAESVQAQLAQAVPQEAAAKPSERSDAVQAAPARRARRAEALATGTQEEKGLAGGRDSSASAAERTATGAQTRRSGATAAGQQAQEQAATTSIRSPANAEPARAGTWPQPTPGTRVQRSADPAPNLPAAGPDVPSRVGATTVRDRPAPLAGVQSEVANKATQAAQAARDGVRTTDGAAQAGKATSAPVAPLSAKQDAAAAAAFGATRQAAATQGTGAETRGVAAGTASVAAASTAARPEAAAAQAKAGAEAAGAVRAQRQEGAPAAQSAGERAPSEAASRREPAVPQATSAARSEAAAAKPAAVRTAERTSTSDRQAATGDRNAQRLAEGLGAATRRTDAEPAPATAGQARAEGQRALQWARDEIVRSAEYVNAGGSQVIRLQLYPPEMGRVRLEMQLRDGELDVQIRVENPQVRDAIRGELEGLSRSLKEADVDVSRFDVSDYGAGPDDPRRQAPDAPQEPAFVPEAEPYGGPEAARGWVRISETGRMDCLV